MEQNVSAFDSLGGQIELVPSVGLEIHVRLATAEKLFCGCKNQYGQEPNSLTCPVCLGLPGTMPVLAADAVKLALTAGIALNSKICQTSEFARKNYFYPDLPRNYQITQFDRPLCLGGYLDIPTGQKTLHIRLQRIHIEEDAGRNLKSVTDNAVSTALDFNRAGTPLIEIVTEPDLRNGQSARQFLQRLRQLLLYCQISDVRMAEGSLRCDVNVGFAPVGNSVSPIALAGPWTEVKNLNSFRSVGRAVDYEIDRLQKLVSDGQKPIRETRSWNDQKNCTEYLRNKESQADYRYFPEPDLPVLVLSEPDLKTIKEQMPELPAARETRFISTYEMDAVAATDLCQRPEIADYFESVVATVDKKFAQKPAEKRPVLAKIGKLSSSWLRTELLHLAKKNNCRVDKLSCQSTDLADLLYLVLIEHISTAGAKQIFAYQTENGWKDSIESLVAEQRLALVTDCELIDDWCRQVIRNNPQQLAQLNSGKYSLLDFFVGQVLGLAKGSAGPLAVRRQLEKILIDRTGE